MILTQQPLYAANTHDPFGVSNCDATRASCPKLRRFEKKCVIVYNYRGEYRQPKIGIRYRSASLVLVQMGF